MRLLGRGARYLISTWGWFRRGAGNEPLSGFGEIKNTNTRRRGEEGAIT